MWLVLSIAPSPFAVAAEASVVQGPWSAPRTFHSANEAYRDGRFEEALDLYEELTRRIRNPYLEFDKGNAAFRAGHLGRAIVAYERAKTMAPRWEPLAANLEFARSQARDDAADRTAGGLKEVLQTIHGWPSTRELCLATLVALWLTSGCLLWMMTRDIPLGQCVTAVFVLLEEPRRALIPAALLPLVLMTLLSGAWTWTRVRQDQAPRGVVIIESVQARSGPGDENKAVFTLHEGTVLHLGRASGAWRRVRLPNGYTGWLPLRAIETI